MVALSRSVCASPNPNDAYMELFIIMDALKRGDTAAMADRHSKAIRSAKMTPNEARREDGLPDLPNGDRLLVPRDLIPLDVLLEHPEMLLTGKMDGGE